MVRDQREVEVVADEGDLEDHHRRGQQAGDGIDRAAGRVHPAAVVSTRPLDGGPGGVETGDQRGGQQCGAQEGQLARPVVVVANFDGHFVTRLSRSPTKVPFSSLPVTITSRPGANGSGTVPV